MLSLAVKTPMSFAPQQARCVSCLQSNTVQARSRMQLKALWVVAISIVFEAVLRIRLQWTVGPSCFWPNPLKCCVPPKTQTPVRQGDDLQDLYPETPENNSCLAAPDPFENSNRAQWTTQPMVFNCGFVQVDVCIDMGKNHCRMILILQAAALVFSAESVIFWM